jgi:DNA-binding beta-propeller fold protein YncE
MADGSKHDAGEKVVFWGARKFRRAALAFVPAVALSGVTLAAPASAAVLPGSAAGLPGSAAGLPGSAAADRAAVAAVAVPAPAAPDRAYPVLVDSNYSSATGTPTDFGPTWKVSLKLRTSGDGLGDIAITPDGKYAYVVAGNAIAVISGVRTAHPKVAATVRPGGTPDTVLVTPDGKYAYVSVYSVSGSSVTTAVKVFSGASTGKLRLATSLSFRKDYAVVNAFTPDGKYAYATGSTPLWPSVLWQISGITTAHPKITWSAVLGVRGSNSWVTPNGKYLYVSTGPLAYGAGYLYRTETARPERVRTFGFPAGATILITPNGRWAYASYWYLNRKNKLAYDIQVISGAQTTPREAGTARLADHAIPIAIQPSGNYAYGISSTGSGLTKTGAVVVLTGASSGHIKAAAIWKLPYAPEDIAVSPIP